MSLPRDLMREAAYRKLSARAQAVLCFLAFSYNGRNNGTLEFGARNGITFGMKKSNTSSALAELRDAGFIAVERLGSFGWKHGIRTAWRLTWRASGAKGATPPTHDYRRSVDAATLISERNRKLKPVRSSGPYRPSERTADQQRFLDRPLYRTTGTFVVSLSSAGTDKYYFSQPMISLTIEGTSGANRSEPCGAAARGMQPTVRASTPAIRKPSAKGPIMEGSENQLELGL